MKAKRASIVLLLTLFSAAKMFSQDIEQVIKAKPFKWTGSVGAGTEFYASNLSESRYDPFTWQVNGNFSMILFETFTLPFSFTVGNQVKNYSLPYFQLGMSPSYKWATLHVGYRNLSHSEYGLNGATFLGTGIDLNPGIFRFSTMFGRFNKATNVDTTKTIMPFPAYKRLGYGTKIGVGTEGNFVDFSFFGAKDDTNSITRPDSTYTISPHDNMVFGVSTKQVLFKKLTLTADYGLSFFTEDLQGPPGSEKTPLKGNSTTDTYHAVKASLGYQFTSAGIRFSYERVDDGYRSLGSYFFNDDFEQILFNPYWSMFQNKVMVNVSAGVQRNNLNKSKGVQDFRLANNISLSINPVQKFGLDINYSNFSMNQRAVNNFDLQDTFKIVNVTNNLNISPRFTFPSESRMQTVFMNYNFQIFNDKNENSSEAANNASHFAMLNYSLFLMQSQWNFTSGINFNVFDQSLVNLKQFGASAGFSKSFLEGALSTSLNNTYNASFLNSAYDGGIYNMSLSVGYTIAQKHMISLNNFLISNQSKTGEDFTEWRGGVRYNFTIR